MTESIHKLSWPSQLLCHSLIGYCSVIISSPGQYHLLSPTGELQEGLVYLSTSVLRCVHLCTSVVCFARIMSVLLMNVLLKSCLCAFKKKNFPICSLHLKEGAGCAGGGEGPVSFISSATVHEACWLRYYFNSPTHLLYYLLICVHHYGGCNLCDE